MSMGRKGMGWVRSNADSTGLNDSWSRRASELLLMVTRRWYTLRTLTELFDADEYAVEAGE